MKTKELKLEWEFLAEEDQDAPWPPAPEGVVRKTGADPRQDIRRTLVFGVALVVFLTVGVGVVYARNEAQTGIAEVEQGVQAATDAEQWVREYAPELSADMLVDNVASVYVNWMMDNEQYLLEAALQDEAPVSTPRIHDTWFSGRSAAADVTLTVPLVDMDAPIVYRQTRFYRETPSGWLRTQPDPRLWGPQVTLETDHLIWQYRQRDHADVSEIAEKMDVLYGQLHQDYGLTSSSPREKLIVHVDVGYLPGQVPLQKQPMQSVVIPSPAVYLVPSEYSGSDILAQTVALAFLESMWAQAVAEFGVEQSYDLLAGLHLWETWDMGLGLSEWSEDVTGWVLDDAVPADDEVSKSYRFDALCAAFGIWMIRPFAIGIPVYCERTESSPMVYPMTLETQGIPTQNGAAESDASSHYAGTWRNSLAKPMILATVVDYAVTMHGRDSLPDLVVAKADHESWETLVPAVYGVSLEEFERGWRQHVNNLGQ